MMYKRRSVDLFSNASADVEDSRVPTLEPLYRAEIWWKLLMMLLWCWVICLIPLLISPTHVIKSVLQPTTRTFRKLGAIAQSILGIRISKLILVIFPLRQLLSSWSIFNYSFVEIAQLETGILIYLCTEAFCYLMYRCRVEELDATESSRSKVDQKLMIRLADRFVNDSSADDIIKFLSYSFYCRSDKGTTNDLREDYIGRWESIYRASRRHNVVIPLLHKDEVITYLVENLGTALWHAEMVVARLEEKADIQFPVRGHRIRRDKRILKESPDVQPADIHPQYESTLFGLDDTLQDVVDMFNEATESQSDESISPLTVDVDDDVELQIESNFDIPHRKNVHIANECPSGLLESETHRTPPDESCRTSKEFHEKSFIFGRSRGSPIYRPIPLQLVIHLCHYIVRRFILPILGFVQLTPLRADLDGAMRFYCRHKNIDTDRIEFGGKISVRPVLFAHGFGFGLIPYSSALIKLVMTHSHVLYEGDRVIIRPIVIPELQWLGLMPMGSVSPQYCVAKVKQLIDMMFNSIWGRTIFNSSPEVISSVYLPLMPEVADECASLMRYVQNSVMASLVPEWAATTIIQRMTNTYEPLLNSMSEYSVDAYQMFGDTDDMDVPEATPKSCRLTAKSDCENINGDKSFLNASLRPDVATYLRDGFMSRIRCRVLDDNNDSRSRSVIARFRQSLHSWSQGEKQKVVETTMASDDSSFDVIAHSYGTAFASCLVRTYTDRINKVALLDPICFLVQLTKNSQLAGLRPWQVIILDEPTTKEFECEAKPVNTIGQVTRQIIVNFTKFRRGVVNRFLLFIYWYAVYRDFGTRWTIGRQMRGHEYIDNGELMELGRKGRLLVAVGLKDLICAGQALAVQLQNSVAGAIRSNLVVNNDHHGVCLLRYSTFEKLASFFNASGTTVS